MKKVFAAVICPLFVSLSGCGGGSSGTPETPTLNTGTFVDSPVANISYQTDTQSGTTNANGQFYYQDGESVTFSIGSLLLPSVSAAEIITPITLAGATSITDQQATNIARLLISLDEDGNPGNGITIPDGAAAVASPVDFNVDAATFASDSAVTNLVANSGGATTTLISDTEAQNHVNETLSNLAGTVAGTWLSDAGNNKLMLFADNTFKYVENDPTAPAPQNGIELGTYTYDAVAGNITFTITSDSNDPGNDSGIGDIGTPAVIDVALSSDNNSLTLAGGALTLSRVNQVVGAWASSKDPASGEGFNYLVLFSDNTFVYAEHDILFTEPDNGVEVGTYTYDSASGDITFSLIYDDNAPGNDSGIGNIGTPAVIDAVLSADHSTLSLASGAVVLNSVDFYDNFSPVGAWSSSKDASSGEGFNHLVLFPNGTFLYAEHDILASAPENGLEVGTYTYDSSTGNISFDIIFDDNAPGNDSGIGDTGGTVVIDSVLSNGSTTLTVAGGAVVLTKRL